MQPRIALEGLRAWLPNAAQRTAFQEPPGATKAYPRDRTHRTTEYAPQGRQEPILAVLSCLKELL